MKFFPRLVARGRWGTVDPPPFTYDLTSRKYFQAAKRNGGLKNLVLLRGFEQADEENGLDANAALIHSYKLVFPSLWNSKAQWTGWSGTALESLPNPFGGNKGGLGYTKEDLENGTEGAPLPTPLSSQFVIERNQPVCLRAFLFAPPKAPTNQAQPRAIWTAAWARWQLRIVDGSFEIARRSQNWTAEKQKQLDLLLDKDEPTLEEQEQIDNIVGPRLVEPGGTVAFEEAIYDLYESLSLGNPIKRDQGDFYEFVIIPEPAGRLNIALNGGKAQSIDVPEVLATREIGTICEASKLTLSSNGQAYLFQPGHLRFTPSASLKIGPFRNGYWTDTIHTSSRFVRADASAPNWNVSIAFEAINSVQFQFKVLSGAAPSAPPVFGVPPSPQTLPDTRFTPFIYAAQISLAAGVRGGSTDVVWDSDAHLDGALNSPILDMQPSFEGAMRRQQWTVEIRDPKGAVLTGIGRDIYCEALENRVVDLSAGSVSGAKIPLLTTGLVVSATLNDTAWARLATQAGLSALRSWICRASTTLSLTICDAWALMDEDLMDSFPIGDGMHLGAYLRLLLRDAGWSNAQLAGISDTAGRELPRAALNETDCIKPGQDQSRGEFLRYLVEEFGMGWMLYIDVNGVWQFQPRQTAVRQLRVYSGPNTYSQHPVEFSSSAATNQNRTYPGRFAVLGPLDHIRDPADHFNHFRVEGWLNPLTGLRLVAEWIVQQSIKLSSGFASLNHIGRLKRMATRRNQALRTADDVAYAVRSLALNFGRPGRFLQFQTYFHLGLMPGDVVRVDGLLCEIVRLPNASIRDDRMTLVVQELADDSQTEIIVPEEPV